MTDKILMMKRRRVNQLLSSSLFIGMMPLMASCTAEPAPIVEITRPSANINLGVASIDIIADYTPLKAPPYIDHKMMPSPQMQLQQWAEDTLSPNLDDGNLLITITKAALKEVDIPSDETLKALFTNEQRLLVTADIEAVFSFSHPENSKSATLTIASSAEASIADKASPKDADAIRYRVVRDAIGRFDQELLRQLNQISGGQISGNNWPLMG